MSNISGGIFNFTGDYTPPESSGEIYNFTNAEPYVLYQIYTDEFIYAATSEGLKIIEITGGEEYAYINYNTGFTTVGGNSNKIYLGTTNSGIKYLNTTCVSGSITTPYDLGTCLIDLPTPMITASSIKYLHVNSNKLTVCTTAGVDYFRFNTNPEIHSKTFTSSAQKCFTTANSLYYTTSGINTVSSGIEYNLNRVDTCLCDWVQPTYSYTTGSGIFEVGIKLTDMYITEGTASNNSNTIFCATSSGVYVIDEYLLHYAIYYTR